jgi:hypothetical protein
VEALERVSSRLKQKLIGPRDPGVRVKRVAAKFFVQTQTPGVDFGRVARCVSAERNFRVRAAWMERTD